MESLSDQMALKQLSRGTWILPHDNIILDIDEDFFGCEAAATRFTKVSGTTSIYSFSVFVCSQKW